MTTPKKTKLQKHAESLDASSGEIESTSNKSPIAEMTSREYLRLNRGEPDDKLIASYTGLNDTIPFKEILDQQIRSIGEANAMNYMQAMDRSVKIHHDIVWQKRRELVIEMNHDTLQTLARHYGISPSAECISDHPDANNLDKGPLLARLHQFFVWDVKYFETAPEMRDTDVEAAIEAAKTWKKGWQPSDTEILESFLHHASACRSANDNILLQALKECIAVTCACPVLEKKLKLQIKTATEQIGDIGDTKNYDNPDEVEASLKTLEKRLADYEEKLQEICSYLHGFTPGKAMPKIIRIFTGKWYAAKSTKGKHAAKITKWKHAAQFTKGKPIGSIVRVAWLADVFHSFWKLHQSAYLASDPSQRESQKVASAHGKKGVVKKADAKWRSFTSQFVVYTNKKDGRPNALSSKKIKDLISEFGVHLILNKTKGATDKRTVARIKDFISTLVTLMDCNADEDKVQVTWNILRSGGADQRKEKVFSDSFLDDNSTHADKKLRGNKGKFRRSSFSSLTLETFKECLEILRGAKQHSNAIPGTGRRSKQKRVKKI